MKTIEHQHQTALISWAQRTWLPAGADIEPGSTIADYLLAIPNGGHRHKATAAKLKAEGVKPGVSDLLLPIRRQGRAGFWLEMKAPKGRPTPDQKAWLARMTTAGYRAEWHDDWTAAAAALADYLGLPAPIPTIPAPKRRAA